MSIYDLYPMLRIMPSSIIYRIGDIPAYPSLSGYKFNSHMWKEIVVKRVSKMVFVSKFIMNEIEKTGRNCDEDIVIYNLPPSRELATNNDWMSDIRNCQLRLGYIGQIRELKGVHILIDSIIKAKQSGFDVSCVLAGDTNLFKEYSDDLISKVERNKLSQKIKFIGEIDNIDAFFKNIDVLCIPTIWPEALGNVLVESKLYKTPAIIFPSGGMPELVSHKIDGFICNDKTAEALIEGFKYYLNNKSRISIEGLNAYNSLANLDITSGLFKQKWLMAFNSVTEKI
jgi:glycosyltransferase involved in cell wall biosynthesis